MELSPTLRAHLDALDPFLEDPSVSEILVAGPDRTFVTRGGRSSAVDLALGEARLRSMADRLLRAMGSRGRPERHEVQTGLIAADLEVTVIGAPRGARCPLVRVLRRRTSTRTLEEVLGAEQLAGEVEAILLDAPHERRSILFSGPHGAPRLDFVVAMTGAWHTVGRVLALETADGPLAAAGVVDLVLDPDVGIEAICAVAPDVVVAFDPVPSTWSDLLRTGRPIVASVEAPDGETALSRIMALVLAGASDLSRPAAEALVESGISSVVELGGTPGESAIGRVGQPSFVSERLSFKSVTRAESKVLPAPEPVIAPPTRAPPRLDTGEYVDQELGELLPEDLVSKSFVHRIQDGDEAPEPETAEADRPQVTGIAGDGLVIVEPPPRKADLDLPDAANMVESEDNTQFGPEDEFKRASSMAIPPLDTAANEPVDDAALDPSRTLAGGEVMAAFDDAVEAVEAADVVDRRDESTGDLTRQPNERTPTVIGGEDGLKPGSQEWAAEAYESAMDDGARAAIHEVEAVEMTMPIEDEMSSPFGPFDDQDIMTASGVAPPTLDPFEIGALDQAASPFDSTRSGGLADRTLGPQDDVRVEPSADDVYDSRIDAGVLDPAEEEWDEDGPSLIIDGPPVIGGYDNDELPDDDDPDRTRAGSFAGPSASTPDVEGRRVKKTRRPPNGRRPNASSSDESVDEPTRRRPPGRRVD